MKTSKLSETNPLSLCSVVGNQMLSVIGARINFLHAEIISVLAYNSSECEALISKEDGASCETSDNAESKSTTTEQEPVEIVSAEEVLKENSLLDDTLLFGSVEATSVD